MHGASATSLIHGSPGRGAEEGIRRRHQGVSAPAHAAVVFEPGDSVPAGVFAAWPAGDGQDESVFCGEWVVGTYAVSAESELEEFGRG